MEKTDHAKIKFTKIKNRTNQKYCLFNSIIFLSLIKIFLLNLIQETPFRKLNTYYSSIDLVIQGNGTKTLFNNTFIKEPFEVLINGVKDNSCQTTCNLIDERNKVTLIFSEPVKSCHSMFKGFTDLIEINLSNFDASHVTTMYWMFLYCSNLEKITFGNINTSSVTSMRAMFNGCSKLVFLNLSSFDTSNVESFLGMFIACTNLKFLDLSHFNTTKLTEMDFIFENCQSLNFLHLFKLDKEVSRSYYDGGMSETVKICSDENTNTYLGLTLDCSDTCFQDNIKIGYNFDKCTTSCKNEGYDYEYNNICYSTSCPSVIFPLFCEGEECDANVKMCYDNEPQGYYLYKDNNIYKKCFDNCKSCFGQGNETINNCIECKDNFIFLNDSLISSNCYEICNYNYYFDESNEYHCTKNNICPGIYNKLISNKKKCIDDCKHDNIYKYEFNNSCYKDCPNGTNLLENNEDNICYDQNPDGYYLDLESQIYKKCYETCNKCNIRGNEQNNNCLECIPNYTFYINPMNTSNCYEKCENYYYFDELNRFKCTVNCPEHLNKLITLKNKCIDDCKKDDIYKYEYNHTCVKEYPFNSIINESNSIFITEETNNSDPYSEIYNLIFINNSIPKNQDIILERFRDIFKIGFNTTYTDEGSDFFISIEKVRYTITTPSNQKYPENGNVSTINLGLCENKLIEEYNLQKTDNLYILKIDNYLTQIPKVEYEIYYQNSSKKFEKLNLSICKNIKIDITIPIEISMNDLDKHNQSSDLYNDICYTFASENNIDISLKDRRNEFVNNNMLVCEEDCEFIEYDNTTKKVSCSCPVKMKLPLISEIKVDKDKLFSNFKDIRNIANFKMLKCMNLLFNANNFYKNSANYMMIILFILSIISIFVFIFYSSITIKNYIKLIHKLSQRNKSENENADCLNKINNNINERDKNNLTNKIQKRTKRKNRILRTKEKFKKNKTNIKQENNMISCLELNTANNGLINNTDNESNKTAKSRNDKKEKEK